MQDLAIVVVDMINDYMTPSSNLYCQQAHDIVENINKLIGFVRQKGGSVIFSNTSLVSPHDPIARKWGMHAVRNTNGSKTFHDIDVRSSDHTVLKRTYNSFFETDLNLTLRSLAVKRVAIVGIHTHVCVLLTASAASDLGYEVVTFSDAMTTGYKPNHDTRLRFFSTHVGELTTTAKFISAP